MQRIRNIILPVLIFLSITGIVQANSKVDSLMRLLDMSEGRYRIGMLNQIAKAYHRTDIVKSIEYANKALEEARDIKYSIGEEGALSLLGHSYYLLGDYDEALDYMQQALLESISMLDRNLQADNYLDIASVYFQLENYEKALDYTDKGIALYKELDDKMGLADAYNIYGNVYEKWGIPISAINKYEQALEIFEDIGYRPGIARTLNNVAIVYYQLGEYNKAQKNLAKALDLNHKMDDFDGIAVTLKNMGMNDARLNRFGEAVSNLEKSLEMARDMHNKSLISTIYNELSTTYALKGDYRSALMYHKKHLNMKDTLINEKSSSKIAELEVKYENVRKEKEKELSRSEQEIMYNRIIIISIISVFALLFIISFVRRYQENQKLTGVLNENFRQLSIQKMKLSETLEILRESEEKFRLIFENSPLGIVHYDKEGVVTASNENHIKIIGLKKQDVIGFNILNNLNDEKMKGIIKESLEGQHCNYEGTYVSIKGKLTYIKADFAPIFNSEGDVLGGIAIVEDISERKLQELAIKRSEQKLRELNATKDKFFSIIAHDLKNPLSIILNMSENLVRKYDKFSDKQKYERAKLVFDSSNTLFKLLENLLEWSRSQTGRIEYDPIEVDLFELAVNNCDLFRENAAKKDIELINEIEFETYAFADKNMISTVIRNLLSNAIKFTPKGGEVKISTVDRGDYMEINVSDTGVGISQDNIHKLFRLDISHSTMGTANEEGTGLGLILCKEFIEKNKGSIRVESYNGQGTNFAFSVPKYQNNNKYVENK